MSGKVTQFKKTQKYRFDFGTDEKLHTAIFNAKIPNAQLEELLSSLHNCLFEKIPNVIFSYLKLHHLEFSNFNSIEIPLEYYDAMEWAGYLLHSVSYGNGEFEHNAIAQSYFYNRKTCEEYGYFAIRKTTGNTLYTIDSSEGTPILPTFGCVDLVSLLPNIENFQTKEDVLKTAVQ